MIHHLDFTCPPTPRAARLARSFLTEWLDAWKLSDLSDAAVLVATELFNNALQHTVRDGHPIRMRYRYLRNGVRIEVHDASQAKPERRETSPNETSGRGLVLVDALTGGEWGVHDLGVSGKMVWAECYRANSPRLRKGQRIRKPIQKLHQEPASITWAREKAGLTKRALAESVGISEQLMGEIEHGWRNARPEKLKKIAEVLNCPVVLLERKRI